MCFQAFFALASGLCAFTTWRDAPAFMLNRALTMVFGITSLHFFLKPFLSSYLSTGVSERYYANTTYALVSQAVTGVLLIAAGLLILINVLQSVVQSNELEARRDPLTGLPNRRALHERFRTLADKALDAGSSFIAIIDLDHFKTINDRFGHEAGDEVLRRVATCLDESRPSAAMIARIGGEEFVLLLTKQSQHGAMAVCEGLRLTVSGLAVPNPASISASIGLTAIVAGEDIADSLRRADRALYAAKDAGRDRCEIAVITAKPRLAVVRGAR